MEPRSQGTGRGWGRHLGCAWSWTDIVNQLSHWGLHISRDHRPGEVAEEYWTLGALGLMGEAGTPLYPPSPQHPVRGGEAVYQVTLMMT